ncbi:hypothetical protein AGLY_017753 [Aphis glycines]|uniref:PiggyBac transposable element-derived protein domain-containing protein n=1 Tax=Aphis glycines TaxID=307491 RepID=A0A6G0SVY7_APHGL|nr:hypothetical protein AGLY_017753 [Aphis glycines]
MANKIDDSDILQLIDIPSGSEDDFESDVDDDQLDLYKEPDITTFEGLISQQFSSESIVDEDVIFPIIEPVVDNSHFSDITSIPSIEVKNVVWTEGNFLVINTHFLGNSDLPSDILELETPFQIFKYFFTSGLLDHICCETYKYGVQNSSSNPLKINNEDLQKYIGILIIMSLINTSNIRNYWSSVLGNDLIKATMTINIFEKIRANLHFNDNLSTSTGPGRDKIHKIRPLIETLRKRFSSIPIEENLAVDEQICSTKARSSLKVYMPNKPHKWGYKFFVLSGASGFAYNFEFCSGQENNSESRKASEPDLGASANVVMHLSTVRRNRLKNVMLPDDSLLMKQPTAHCISKVLDTDIVAVIWKDTKIVSLLSTFTAIDPVVKVSRFDRKQKKRIEVDCPNIIQVYNRHMGGIDLLDGLLGRHKIKMRSRKWYMSFPPFIGCNCRNNLLYLCKICTYTPKRGRPTNDVQEGIIKKGKMGTKIGQHAPPKEVRTDKLDHWPIESEKKTRCKNPGCKGFTFMMCGKCQIRLIKFNGLHYASVGYFASSSDKYNKVVLVLTFYGFRYRMFLIDFNIFASLWNLFSTVTNLVEDKYPSMEAVT